jgi:hypothetical protein
LATELWQLRGEAPLVGHSLLHSVRMTTE